MRYLETAGAGEIRYSRRTAKEDISTKLKLKRLEAAFLVTYSFIKENRIFVKKVSKKERK